MSAIATEYVNQAEKVIENLPRKPRGDYELSTSQMRNLLSLTAQIFDEAQLSTDPTLPAALLDKVRYLRVRFIYQAGREPAVKRFITDAKLLEALSEVGDSRDRLLTYCRYMEALVAYKKYLDPKDK